MYKCKKIAVLIFYLAATTNVYCQEITNESIVGNFGKPVIDYGQIAYVAIFLITMIVIAFFVIKKSNLKNSTNSGLIDVVYNYAVTSKDKLLIARVGKEYLLLSVSNSGIRKLHEFDDDYIQKAISENDMKSNDFSKILINMLGKYKNA